MTPEEKFNQDVWWILQEIRKEEYLTPTGQKVEFFIRSLPNTKSIRRKDVDYGFPQSEAQRKLLNKLQEWEAIDDVKPVDDTFRGSDALLNPTIYRLTIKQPKFDEVYKKYENLNNPKEQLKSSAKGDKSKENNDYSQSIFLLKTFYTKLLEILDAFAGGYIAVRNTVINHYYTVLNSSIDEMLNKKEFTELKNDKPDIFESLIGDIEDFDVEWEFGSKRAYDFLGRIEKLYILAGSPEFALPTELKMFLQKTDEAISEHRKYCYEQWQKMEKRVENYKKQWDSRLGIDDKKPEPKESGDKVLEAINGALVRGFENMFTGSGTQQQPDIKKIEITNMPPVEIKNPKALNKKEKNAKKAVLLNQFGDLYREPKNKYCYEMGEKDDRHKIIRYLIGNKGYQPTSQIALELGKNEDSVIDTIGKLNSIAKGKLNIKDNLILGKKGSGYRISPDYNFSLKTE